MAQGMRAGGGPHLRFGDVCKRDMKSLSDIDVDGWEDLTINRHNGDMKSVSDTDVDGWEDLTIDRHNGDMKSVSDTDVDGWEDLTIDRHNGDMKSVSDIDVNGWEDLTIDQHKWRQEVREGHTRSEPSSGNQLRTDTLEIHRLHLYDVSRGVVC